ncbi:RNA polymerase II C-terminal domain phosphatase-like 1 [Vicia villosa]|uniref:RNA polymerase II C-terminal domain phosphatase-like 1 n=1 Tax=Vicia villosa TaxID=3911 RepID=UPI00273CA238|nr:RNA polymerase II C-terminal domain phosphatase-like 1 [Vicia villosa]XP_058730857.1 RNA polymerase II C-terminal domain phosphatase-like 1 [Vicia villosa]
MYKSVVYQGEVVLGEVDIYPEVNNSKNYDVKEIQISHFSQPSERCPPLAVLHTIASCGVCFKMESKTQHQNQLFHLHSLCIRENKTAVMPLFGEELHLVAMHSRNDDRPCFWGFIVAKGLYNSSLVMLNLRCLGIVFDLDETLIVANTMRSFEDRIDSLQRKINSEVDPQRISGMQAEIKRYLDDKSILKQYAENDQIVDNGKVIKAQSELVPALSDSHQPLVRPLIRLHEKNIILTRISPQIRDTSVLVRMRPAWEDLRSYLTARGRKRFEVYVCTMAERDYALEMWRLLDPDSNLINSKELLGRIVCVKSGLKKSLFNVFQDGSCHPKTALVIDDRLKVWDEKDQPRVHVVPAFAPYYAPQAEASNTVPVLCVARNVACNVRGGFFKDFDDGLLQKIPQIAYEDDIQDIPPAPDVSNYLVSEDDGSAACGNRDPLLFDGMADAEIERKLKDAISAVASVIPMTTAKIDPRLTSSLQYSMVSPGSVPPPAAHASMIQLPHAQFPQPATLVKPMGQVAPLESSLHSSPAREEGEVGESELDPDTRRRLLILQHGQDIRDHTSSEPPFPVRHPNPVQVPARVPSRGGWFPVEEEIGSQPPNRVIPKEIPLDSGPSRIEKYRPHQPPFFPKVDGSISSDRALHEGHQRLPKEIYHRDDRTRINHALPSYHSLSGDDIPFGRSSSSNRDLDSESGHSALHAETPAVVLQEIALKCGTKVEFTSSLAASRELQFSIEAWFSGKKIGQGFGRTRVEAQYKAAEDSIKHLADIYLSRAKDESGSAYGDASGFPNASENGYVGNVSSLGNHPMPKEESVSFSAASDPSRVLDPRLDVSKRLMGSVSALKELCMMEGLGVNFLSLPVPVSTNSGQKDEVHAQVEIDGQVYGKGIGLTWDEAKMQAAEKALGSLRTMQGQSIQRRQSSPRPFQGFSNKRLKQEHPRTLQRFASSGRYPRNAPPIP